MTIERTQLGYVGKWLEAEAIDLGIPASRPPEHLNVSGIRGPGETLFVRRRLATRRGRRCAEYASFAGRQVRLWLEPAP